MLIEDHELMRLFLANYLSSDYQVHSVATIKVVKPWIKYQHADLILADFPQKEDDVEMT